MVTEGRGSKLRTVRLDEAVKAHCVTVTSVLDRIYEKSIKTFFRGQDNRIAEFKKKLEDLRFIRDGNVIIPLGRNATDPAEIRIVFVTPQKTPDKASRHARRKDRGNTLPHDR
jgi:hypothetical protein